MLCTKSSLVTLNMKSSPRYLTTVTVWVGCLTIFFVNNQCWPTFNSTQPSSCRTCRVWNNILSKRNSKTASSYCQKGKKGWRISTGADTCLVARATNADDVVVSVVIDTLTGTSTGVTSAHDWPNLTDVSGEAIRTITGISIYAIQARGIIEARVGGALVCKTIAPHTFHELDACCCWDAGGWVIFLSYAKYS